MIDPESLPGSTFRCRCGDVHSIPTKHLVYDEDALARLPEILGSAATAARVSLIADCRTYAVAGERAKNSLLQAGWTVEPVIVPDPESGLPACDDATFDKLDGKVGDADIFLAVGSGTVNDLTKWLAAERGKPYAVVATAASMNGYTAANVAPMVKGIKKLVRARAPVAVIALPSVIAAAPFEMTASGLGDVLAKPVSTADWLLNHLIFGEHFCEECAGLISAIEPLYVERPEDVRDRKPDALEALVKALMYTGLAMTMIGTSAPASGGEHLFSHTLDMMSALDGVSHDLHGRQVGIGTIFAAALYERLLAIETPCTVPMAKCIDTRFWGRSAGAVEEQYAAKQRSLALMREKVSSLEFWEKLRAELGKRVDPPGRIADCLERAGAARYLRDIHCSPARARAAFLHMHEFRQRCTVVDLAWTMGVMPDAVDEIFNEWFGGAG